jgi:NAD(P)-dependent dehydrogenase (short-subunit alcohol dehydrogenase family)
VLTGRDETLGTAAEEQLASLGAAKFIRADAGDPDQARASVDQAVGLLGGLDILVNNAGVGVLAGVLETPLNSYDLVMDVNVRGAFVYAQAAFPHLEARGGAMLHVASDAGVMGEEDIGIYSVSKAALVMLSNMLAIEGGRRGVRSNAVCPGDTAPGMRHMGPPGHDRPEDDPEGWIVPPLGRVGLAIDVAEAAVYLCSPRAAFVNGVALLVDGGMRAGMRTDRPAGP